MNDTTQVRTYSRRDCVVFRKTNAEFGGLSNMAPGFPLVVNGSRIRTAEALYQACRFPHLPDLQRLIIGQQSPMTAKMKSKPHRRDSRRDWYKERVKIMRWSLRVKLAQNWKSFGSLLLATDERPIVEESRKDDFWGAKPEEEGSLVGMNILGRLLMELRRELRGPHADRLKRVETPQVPQFLLMGKPIGIVDGSEEVAGVQVDLFADRAPGRPQQAKVTVSGVEPTDQRFEEEGTPAAAPAHDTGERSMIPRDCKRLAEVDFPIAVVSRHAAREKSIRQGHPSTLHLWWARRPLASCRAVLLALLLPDPCDEHCPPEFKGRAREALGQLQRIGPSDEDLRRGLLQFIGDFADWNHAAHPRFLEAGRALVRAAYPDEPPLVVDPFAGGGSIPLEALRLGCDAFASDLNPIPVLLCRVLLEDVPRFGVALTDAVNEAVLDLAAHLRRDLAPLYPPASVHEEPTAYLWARTVSCEAPRCGAAIPLLRSMWLSRKKKNPWALRIDTQTSGDGRLDTRLSVFSPTKSGEVGRGTIVGGRAVCPACSTALSRGSVAEQLRSQRGGTESARLVAVTVATAEGRVFRSPIDSDLDALQRVAQVDADLQHATFGDGTSVYPDEEINPVRPSPNARGLSAVTRYGMTTFSDCFLPRQRLALAEVVRFVRKYDPSQPTLAGALGRCLLIILGRCVDRWSSCCRLDSTRDTVTGSFSKQALQMVWDFCEANPLSEWSGGFGNAANWVTKALEKARVTLPHLAQVQLADARDFPLPDQSAQVWFTDPPYYDSVPYADLADFFFCWLRRANPKDPSFSDPFDQDNVLTPKARECVWNQSYTSGGRQKDPVFFEDCVSGAFEEGARSIEPGGVGCVVFAHKSTDGWEALLSGMIRAGLSVTSSWPIQTEMKARTAAREAASLMGSIHLVCRPRPDDAQVGDWAEVLREMPGRVDEWMSHLQGEGVHGADLLFACIGPALEIYSRYARVEKADGTEVPLALYLEKVWEVVGRTALAQVLGTEYGAGALEEDARLVALFLWTLQSTAGMNGTTNAEDDVEAEQEEPAEDADEDDEGGSRARKPKGYTLIYDVVRRFAQPLGIHLEDWERRIIETKKGSVRLLPVRERATQLFGQEGTQAAADRLEAPAASPQLSLFPEMQIEPRPRRGRRKVVVTAGDDTVAERRGGTTLDRVHAAMLLQASGRSNALRSLLAAEVERGSEFLRLANALSALHPRGSEEKRLVDAMLLAVPR